MEIITTYQAFKPYIPIDLILLPKTRNKKNTGLIIYLFYFYVKNSNIQSYQNTKNPHNFHYIVLVSIFASCFFFLFLNLSLFSNLTSLLWSESPIQPRNSQISKNLRIDTSMCSLNLPNDKDSQSIARVYHSIV